MNRRVLFLDFDGVLHDQAATLGHFARAPALAAVLVGKHVDIVVSSSWRFQHSIARLRELLPHAIASRLVACTGEAFAGRHARYREITQWLQRSAPAADWRALDDSAWEFPSSCLNLIACNPSHGLQDLELQVLAEWLA